MAASTRKMARRAAFLCCSVVLYALTPFEQAWADAAPTLYRLIDIGPLAREHIDPERFGINSLHEAVGSAWGEVVGQSTVEFGWVWLPSSSSYPGLSAGRHKLYGPGGSSGGPTRALAINDDGIVVGQARFDGEDHAALWDLSDGLDEDDPIDLGLLTTGHDEATSIAFGVSNDSTPTVVASRIITSAPAAKCARRRSLCFTTRPPPWWS